ncbi:MAG TPA: DUF4198 domain-containing protein [Pyrinomonadaceae bacterium]|nr:DUF4198 domain-containing protein [Pyrinomonadaceae bacterium]
MRRKIFSMAAICVLAVVPALAHDLFLKLDSFFAAVDQRVTIKILNGSFMASEGAVRYERLADLTLVSPSGARSKPSEADFTMVDKTSHLTIQPNESGNYLIGLSTMPREIDLEAKSFNEYLVEDGIPDTLAERERDKELEKNIRERYSKHVKTLFQVGNKQTGNYNKVLGYPVEIVPRSNPYKLKAGDTFEFLCLKDGKPLANQYVMTGHDDGTNLRIGANIRTDNKGIGKVKLTDTGKWYVKFINMTKLTDPKINYESKWATFTFEIK